MLSTTNASGSGPMTKLCPTETAKLQIRNLYAAITEARNARQFDRNKEPWYSALTSSPGLQIEVAYGGHSHVSIDEYLEIGKVMFGGNPSLFVEVTGMEIDICIGSGGHRRGRECSATVWAQQALKDEEVELVRRSIVVAEFRKHDEGEQSEEAAWKGWRCVGMRHIKGMDDGVGI
ncbi:hypothetical protein BST61_g9773 [Cercospora zeina]